jgi:hypothetical protein
MVTAIAAAIAAVALMASLKTDALNGDLAIAGLAALLALLCAISLISARIGKKELRFIVPAEPESEEITGKLPKDL